MSNDGEWPFQLGDSTLNVSPSPLGFGLPMGRIHRFYGERKVTAMSLADLARESLRLLRDDHSEHCLNEIGEQLAKRVLDQHATTSQQGHVWVMAKLTEPEVEALEQLTQWLDPKRFSKSDDRACRFVQVLTETARAEFTKKEG